MQGGFSIKCPGHENIIEKFGGYKMRNDRRYMKNAANIITIARMILSILLLFLLNNRVLFFIVFLICGLSDVADGIIARKSNTGSKLGAKLDSFADLLLYGISTAFIFISAGKELRVLWLYLAMILLIRFFNMIIAARKFHTFAIIHTWGNKLTGVLVFAAYAIFIISGYIGIFVPICIIAALSALEETAIHISAKELDLDRRSIF